MTFLIVLAALVGGYYALCWHLVFNRGGFGFCYNALVAWCLSKIGAEAITIGSTCYVRKRLYLMPSVSGPGTRLYRHEHAHFDAWRAHPFTFVPTYLWNLLWFGYDKHPEENRARREAGEPER